jgi:CRP-like cAMP-binding protein
MAEETSLYQKFGRSVDPGETIFEEGEAGNQMFIIQDGKVRVSKRVGGREHVLAVLGKGEFFGEMAIVTNAKRTATVKAMSPVKLLSFNRDGFVSMINKNPKIALNIIDKLCRRVQNSNLQIQHLVRKNGRALVALNLLYAFRAGGQEENQLYYDRTLEEISLSLELPRDTVSAYLDDFERGGIVKTGGNQIALLDEGSLSQIAENVG